MASREILVVSGGLPKVLPELEEKFQIHKYWQADNKDAFLAEVLPKIRAIILGGGLNIDAPLIDRCQNLEIIANFGVGYDAIDASYAATKGVVVTHTPNVLNDEVADTAIALLISTVRELGAAERWLRAGKWQNQGAYPLTPETLNGKTLGIIGLGRIGKKIAERAEVFGLKIVYHGRNQQPDQKYRYYENLNEMAVDSDVLLSVIPGSAETTHLVTAETFKALGPTGIFINIGRGSTVDENAMVEAIQNGTIYSVGLDVFEFEPKVPQALIDHDRSVLLPHVGSASIPTRDAMGSLVVENIISWFDNGKAVTPVPESQNLK